MCRQLSGVFTHIFSVSFFKKSTIFPVSKKATSSCETNYRPVALTSVCMKTLERLVLQFLKSIIDPSLDRFQFAYRENRSVDDAISLGGLFYGLQQTVHILTLGSFLLIIALLLIQLCPQNCLRRYRMLMSHNPCVCGSSIFY